MATEKLETAIEATLDRVDDISEIGLLQVGTVEDGKTTEEFLEVAIWLSPEEVDGVMDVFQTVAPPTVAVFTQLVEKGFDYPMEVVVFFPDGKGGALPAIAFRVSLQWIREHIHGNLTLEQMLAMVYDSAQVPDDVADATSGWVPEYPLDWRAVDGPEEIGAGVDFDYWTSGKVPYPDEEE